ncbi:helix-turn-helix domain-containing protein [Haloferula sp. A504]|uniref:helix-turn-helix domain-containing protein n=1 Tax=Haloferula sp. A504 TaxID=3373601 RepID=UPI0031C9ADED|nr:helix-turn-helix domain-containing protein [Verrucomicrobiaceae bacterium E54]
MSKRTAENHPVAVLRNALGIDRESFAQQISSSKGTIQAVELYGRTLLTEEAVAISSAYGVSASWLMAGDPGAPIRDCNEMLVEHWPKWQGEEKYSEWVAGRKALWNENRRLSRREEEILEAILPVVRIALRRAMRAVGDTVLDSVSLSYTAFAAESLNFPWPSKKPARINHTRIRKTIAELAKSPELWESDEMVRYDTVKSANQHFKQLPETTARELLQQSIAREKAHFERGTGPYRLKPLRQGNPRYRHGWVWRLANRAARLGQTTSRRVR